MLHGSGAYRVTLLDAGADGAAGGATGAGRRDRMS